MAKIYFKPLALEELQARFIVDSTSPTGLRWKISPSRAIKAGYKAGTLTPQGYWQVRFNGEGFKNHRIVWALVHGKDPGVLEIDHINGVRSDNRIENLRLVNRRQNFQNKTNQSKHGAGVFKVKDSQRFYASIGKNNVRFYLGAFDSAEEARLAYCKAEQKLEDLAEAPIIT